jgi:uncharacterized protein
MRDYSEVIPVIEQRVKQQMENDSTGHDWWHVDRVRRTALIICEREQGNAERVELVALLHDVDDWKLKKEPTSESLANQWLLDAGVSEEESHQICEIIDRISFKGHGVEDNMPFLDGQIVQDADRLDAIGAIGIARCFAFGGAKDRAIYDPHDPPVMHQSFEDYKTKSGPSINHFYEKLLHLKDRLNTPTARTMSEERHAFLETFLKQFDKEWNGL